MVWQLELALFAMLVVMAIVALEMKDLIAAVAALTMEPAGEVAAVGRIYRCGRFDTARRDRLPPPPAHHRTLLN